MKKVIIIGGGIAGLTAGVFGRLNGFDTTIIEKNQQTGGECMGWDRQQHHIDGCIHWLVGTKVGTPMYALWETIGGLKEDLIHHPTSFMVFHHDNDVIHLYNDLDKLRESWSKIAPEDQTEIDQFCNDVRKLHKFEIPTGKPLDMMRFTEKIAYFMSMKEAGLIMSRYGKIDIADYAKRYKHPALRAMFMNSLPKGYRASSVFFALSMFMKGQASLPYGGSLAFVKRIEKRYLDLGGKLLTNKTVSLINIEHKTAQGVTLTDGTFIESDYVIASLDAKHFFDTLLEGKYQDKQYQKRFNDPQKYPLASQIQVSLSVAKPLHDHPRTQSFPVETFNVLGKSIERLAITHYSHEPSFAPEGKTVVTVAINQFKESIDQWFKLYKDPSTYKQHKKDIGQFVAQRVLQAIPDLQEEPLVLDVTTPVTYARYCHATQGAFMAFLPVLKGKNLTHSGKIKKLDNVYLSGQWLQPPGGLPVAALTGKDVIRRLCKKEKRFFIEQ